MKKCILLFLLFAGLISLGVISGCGDNCCCCREDVSFPGDLDSLMPYQVGDIVRFANADGDTLNFHCDNREYSQSEKFIMDRPGSECCPSYFVEGLICKLSDGSENSLRISNQNYGIPVFDFSVKMNNIQYSSGGLEVNSSIKEDSIQLVDKTFYEVSVGEYVREDSITLYVGLKNRGIVGFVVNDEAWVLVE